MPRQLLVRQGGGAADEIDLFDIGSSPIEGAPVFDEGTSLLEMGQQWEQGSAAQGFFKFVDPTAASGVVFRPHATVKLVEEIDGDDYFLAWMRIQGGWDVGRPAPYTGGDRVEHDIQLADCNLDLRGLPFRDGWSRPAETTWERLQALAAAKLAGSSSTQTIRRSTTNITVDRFTNGHLVDATDPIDMEANDYPAGTDILEILDDIMGQWGKGWGITLHHVDGVGTHRCLLVQDYDDLAKFTSPLKISDQLSDWDPDHPTAPVFEPKWVRGKGKLADNDAVISGLISIYGGLDDNPRTVAVETGESPDDWEVFWGVYNDDLSHTLDPATRRANAILNDRKRPYVTNQPSIVLKPEQTTLITAGQAIQVKSVVINQDSLKHTYTWRRIAEIRWEPRSDGMWWAHLSLDRPRNSHPAVGGTQPGSTTPKPAPDQVPNPGDTVEKFYNANDPGGDAESWAGNLANQGGSGDGANGTDYYNFKSASPNKRQTSWAASAGNVYRIDGYVNTSSRGQLTFSFHSSAAGTSNPSDASLTEAAHVISPAQPNSGNSWVHFTAGPFTAPTGTNSAALGRTDGVSWDELTIYLVGDPAENDEQAVNYGEDCPHESPFFLPSDYLMCRLDGIEGRIPAILDDLGDVDTTTSEPSDGDVLTWDDSEGQWIPLSGVLTDSGQFVTTIDGGKEVVHTVAAAGSTETLDLATGNVMDVTLTADCTLTLTGATAGVACTMGILLRQGTGAPWDVTWPGSVDWIGGSAPDLSGMAEDEWVWVILMTLDGGTTWFADGGGGGTTGSAGHTIKENGTPLTARTGLNFGSGIVATDDSGNDETDVDLDWAEDADVSTQAFGDAAATGTSQEVARGGHKHAMPANPVTSHEAASDPHTGYVLESLGDAKGDLIGFSADNTPAKIGVGSEAQFPVARSAATPGIAWETQYAALSLTIDQGNAVITTGVKGDVRVPFACEIVGVTLMASQSGAIQIDIWKDTLANFPPDNSDSITASAEPKITATGNNSEDTTLTGWTKTLAAGDVLRFNVDSVTSIKRVTLSLRVKRT